MVVRKSLKNVKRFCVCGCGTLIRAYSTHGENSFVNGHHCRGKRHYQWKDGKTISIDRYMLIRKSVGQKGYIREHRLIYEQYYKCCILPWIDCHHINGKRLDNRIENLCLMSKSEHAKKHIMRVPLDRICIVCGSTTTYKKHGIYPAWFKTNEGYECDKCNCIRRYYRKKTTEADPHHPHDPCL